MGSSGRDEGAKSISEVVDELSSILVFDFSNQISQAVNSVLISGDTSELEALIRWAQGFVRNVEIDSFEETTVKL